MSVRRWVGLFPRRNNSLEEETVLLGKTFSCRVAGCSSTMRTLLSKSVNSRIALQAPAAIDTQTVVKWERRRPLCDRCDHNSLADRKAPVGYNGAQTELPDKRY